MPTIQKRNGKYTVTARAPGSRSVSKTFTTKRVALDWGRRTEDAMKAGTYVSDRDKRQELLDRDQTNPTLSDALSEYEEWVASGHKGYEREKGRIRICRELDIAQKRLSEITKADVRSVIQKWQRSGLSGDTVRSRLAHINGAYRHYEDLNGGLESPAVGLKKPKRSQARDRRLQGDEEVRIYEAAKRTRWPYMSILITLAIETAWRAGELRTLTWRDVDLSKGTITLPAKRSKTGKGRETPLSPHAHEALAELRKRVRGNKSIWGEEPTQMQFVVWWKGVAARAGCEGLRFHDLRHEACSRLAERGMEIFHIAAFFSGHESMQMLKRYTHLRERGRVKDMLKAMHEERLAA